MVCIYHSTLYCIVVLPRQKDLHERVRFIRRSPGIYHLSSTGIYSQKGKNDILLYDWLCTSLDIYVTVEAL